MRSNNYGVFIKQVVLHFPKIAYNLVIDKIWLLLSRPQFIFDTVQILN